MKTRRILFVNSDLAEIERMQQLVRRMGAGVSMASVPSGREALDVLMGAAASQEKPDVIIASSQLPDMSAFELPGIVRKYYSLVNLKFLLLTDRAEPAADDPLEMDGYLLRPLTDDDATAEKLLKLVTPSGKMRLSLLAGTGTALLKQKIMLLTGGWFSAGKIAVGASCALIPGILAVQSLKEGAPHNGNGTAGRNATAMGTTCVPAEEVILPPVEAIVVPVPAQPAVIAAQCEPVPVTTAIAAIDTTVSALFPEPEPVPQEKKSSTGVRPTEQFSR